MLKLLSFIYLFVAQVTCPADARPGDVILVLAPPPPPISSGTGTLASPTVATATATPIVEASPAPTAPQMTENRIPETTVHTAMFYFIINRIFTHLPIAFTSSD
jgi:hypothetical protein